MSDLRRAPGERAVLARGTVGVDPKAAIAKLREYMLTDPSLYVAELVRAMIELGATRIEVDNDADDFVLTADLGDKPPPEGQELTRLLEQLFATNTQALRLMAIATNTALGMRPKFIDWYIRRDATSPTERVRFVSLDPNDEPSLDGALSQVAAPSGMGAPAIRVHVQERFGPGVLREWFGQTAETRVLTERCARVSVPLVWRRDQKPIVKSPQETALATTALGNKLDGSMSLSPRFSSENSLLECYELSVLLSRESLWSRPAFRGLTVRVNERALPTNVSRSQVDLATPFGRSLNRAMIDARSALLGEVLKALDGPHSDEAASVLRALLLAQAGEQWKSILSSKNPSEEDRALLPVIRAKIIPMITGARESLAHLASLSEGSVLAHREPLGHKGEHAAWLSHVVHVGRDPVIAALVDPLGPGDAAVAFAHAAQAHERKQRFLSFEPRKPRLAGREKQDLLRIALGSETTQETPHLREALAVITTEHPVLGELEGELVIALPSGGENAEGYLEITVFVDGRPLPSLRRKSQYFSLRAAVSHSQFAANSDFSGPLEDKTVAVVERALIALAEHALRFATLQLCDPDKVAADDQRVHWVLASAARLEASERGRFLRSVLLQCNEQRGASTARRLINALLEASPSLLTENLFVCANRSAVSLGTLRASYKQFGALLTVSRYFAITHPTAPVVLLSNPRAASLVTLLVEASSLIDYAPWAASTRKRIERENADLQLSITHGDVQAVASLVPKSAYLHAHHRGLPSSAQALLGELGAIELWLEDPAMIPRTTTAFALEWLGQEARHVVREASFDLLSALVDHLSGRSPSAQKFARKPGPVHDTELVFVLSSVARLRALKEPRLRGVLANIDPAALLSACEALPLIAVRTAQGARRETLQQLHMRAQRGPLVALTSAPEDIDYDSTFEPLIMARGELEALVSAVLNVRIAASDDTLAARRVARQTRIARENFAQKPQIEADDFKALGPIDVVEVSGKNYRAFVALLPATGPTHVEVLVDNRVAIRTKINDSLADYGLLVRITFDDDGKSVTPSLDALTDRARGVLAIAVKKALAKLVLRAAKRANTETDPGPSVLNLVVRYCAGDGRVDEAMRQALMRAPLWPAIPQEIASIADCSTHGRGRLLVVEARDWQWIAAQKGETDPVAIVLPTYGPTEVKRERETRKLWLDALKNISGLATRDATHELSVLQSARQLLRDSKDTVKLEGDPPSPSLAGRLEDYDAKLGVGALWVIPETDKPQMVITVFAGGRTAQTVKLPSPIALRVAIESTLFHASAVKENDLPDAVRQRLLIVARQIILKAFKKSAALPSWSVVAQRWALATGGKLDTSLRALTLWTDSTGEPMSLDDMDAQQRTLAFVRYTTSDTPMTPLDASRRVVRVTQREADWLGAHRAVTDYTETLTLQQKAIARRALAPANKITIVSKFTDVLHTVALTVSEHGYEGAIQLLQSRPKGRASLELWHQRRPLCTVDIESPWPAVIAVDASELTLNEDESAPVEDRPTQRMRADLYALVRGAIEQRFVAPPEGQSLSAIRVERAGSPALSKGQSLAVGMLWLAKDAGARGTLRVRIHEESREIVVNTRSASGRKEQDILPVFGELWVRGDLFTADSRELITNIVAWGYRALLAQALSTTLTDEPTRVTHGVRAALGSHLVSEPLVKFARDTLLPNSATSLEHLQAQLNNGESLTYALDDDPADAIRQRMVVVRQEVPWQALLREHAKLGERRVSLPTPVEAKVAMVPSEPAVSARVQANPTAKKQLDSAVVSSIHKVLTTNALGYQVLLVLRASDVSSEHLAAVDESDARAPDELVVYDGKTLRATIFLRHPLAAEMNVWPEPARRDKVLAMAVLGAMNRVRAQFTDQDEARVLSRMLDCFGRS
ncbi:MAG: hypothetical protein Q8Q09_24520 [Deltaproteobacteria bacterium]|nr:hypothetical protein [Deltaproteobacteria bacterium]